MSALPQDVLDARLQTQPRCALVLLGTGQVGTAFLRLLDGPAGRRIALCGVANSRYQQTLPAELVRRDLRGRLALSGGTRDDDSLLHALEAHPAPCRVIVDATASVELAARHTLWLARGMHVATANKALAGGGAAGWRALQHVIGSGPARYGDSATVGAGLPVLATLRRLRACGDTLLRIEGVFSGSLSWLFNRHDGTRPFSHLLAEARLRGYTEPDPRADLDGEDAARKLLILTRAAGCALVREQIEVESLVPPALRGCSVAAFTAAAQALDTVLDARLREARARGAVLRHLACFDARTGRARVGLEAVASAHPAAALRERDNLFALHSARYGDRPLVIQGAGAGPELTAQALLGDVLALS